MAENPVDITDIITELAALRETAALMREKLAKAEEQIADLRQDRDQWREAQRRATLPSPTPPDETPAPTPWWRWLRTTGCFAGAGLLLALATVDAGAQQQPRECFGVALNTQASRVDLDRQVHWQDLVARPQRFALQQRNSMVSHHNGYERASWREP